MGQIEFIDMTGAVGNCERCGERVRVAAADKNPDAKMHRLAAAPKGYCINCSVREWFYIMRDAVRDLDPKALPDRAHPVGAAAVGLSE